MSLSKTTMDHETLQAIGVLMRAVEQVRVPGVLEFRLLTNALRRAIESRSDRDLDEAARIFQTLDRDFRARIVTKAQETAQAEAAAHHRDDRLGDDRAGRTAAAGLVRSATGFLAALNGRRGVDGANKPAGKDSSSTAKARLKQAVEERRERDLTASALVPGVPLPRSSWSS